jgi:hypothetical protein
MGECQGGRRTHERRFQPVRKFGIWLRLLAEGLEPAYRLE